MGIKNFRSFDCSGSVLGVALGFDFGSGFGFGIGFGFGLDFVIHKGVSPKVLLVSYNT